MRGVVLKRHSLIRMYYDDANNFIYHSIFICGLNAKQYSLYTIDYCNCYMAFTKGMIMAEKLPKVNMGEIVNTQELEKQIEVTTLLDRAIELHAKLAEVKDLYKQMDEVTDKLLKLQFRSIIYKDIPISMVDNFKDKNTAFKATGFRRFELNFD